MTLSSQDWHQRYSQQARWTESLREYLFQRVQLENCHRVLDVGCGTGAIETSMKAYVRSIVTGLDISSANLRLAQQEIRLNRLVQGDALDLPFPSSTFDLVFCHFTLLWVMNPAQVLSEMARVSRPGGAVIALAEPDYGGRIDFPEALGVMGDWQQQALSSQGADPRMGRQLAGLFNHAGLQECEFGVLGGQWQSQSASASQDSEWKVLAADLESLTKKPDKGEIERLRAIDETAWKQGERVLFVPTFYAWGRKPSS